MLVNITTIGVAWYLLEHARAAGMGSGATTLVLGVFVFYAFVYTPVIAYVLARMEGIVGQNVSIPFVREATFIFSGYQGVAVWFLPVPLHNYGQATVLYRQSELTGTSFWSIWKSEILLTPIIIGGSILFAHLLTRKRRAA